MSDVIGKSLSEANSILLSEGYNVDVIEYITDKQKEWDTMIVVRQNIVDKNVSLVVTNFKVRV